jgi:primosomal protein N''
MSMVDYVNASLIATYQRRLRELRADRKKATTAAEKARIDKAIRHFEQRLG